MMPSMVRQVHVYLEPESITSFVGEREIIVNTPSTRVRVRPATEEELAAQRERCRAAGEEWERLADEATLFELTEAVYARQAAAARAAATTAQQRHQDGLNDLWRLEATRAS